MIHIRKFHITEQKYLQMYPRAYMKVDHTPLSPFSKSWFPVRGLEFAEKDDINQHYFPF